MAVVQEQVVIIRLSKLCKSTKRGLPDASANLIDDDFEVNVEALVSELVEDGIIVEVERSTHPTLQD